MTMKVFLVALACLFLLACETISSDLSQEELARYSAEVRFEERTLKISLDNPPGERVTKMVYAVRHGSIYIGAQRAGGEGGIVDYTFDLSEHTTLPDDLRGHIFWVNPDKTAEPLDPKFLR